MLDIHAIIGYDDNSTMNVYGSLFVGNVDNGDEYIATKDSFGDEIMFRDEKSHIIDFNLLENFINVDSKLTFPVSPRIVFQIADKDSVKLDNVELMKQFNNNATMFKPMIELLQLNDTRYRMVPYMTSDRVFVELQKIKGTSTNLTDELKQIIMKTYGDSNIIIQKLWNLYKEIILVCSKLVVDNSNQFKDILMTDFEILKTKCMLDDINEEVLGLDIIGKKFAHEDFDLRRTNTSDTYSFALGGGSRTFGKYYILQTSGLTVNPELSAAMIELCGGVVVDYINGADKDNGVSIDPNYINNPNSKVFLKGGRSYRIYRTADTIVPSKTYTKENDDIISRLSVAPPSYRYGSLITNKTNIFLKNKTSELIEITID